MYLVQFNANGGSCRSLPYAQIIVPGTIIWAQLFGRSGVVVQLHVVGHRDGLAGEHVALGQVVLGQDGNPDGLGDAIRHASWALSLDYAVTPWLQPLLRFEEAYFDSVRRRTLRSLVLGVQVFLHANFRLRLESAAGLTEASSHRLQADLLVAL